MTNGPEDSMPSPNPDGEPSHEWDSDEALEFLQEERTVFGDGMTNVELTRKLIEDAAPMAAVSMIHLSRHAVNENTRMNASKWVVEMATNIETEDGKAAWEKMLPDVVHEAEKIAHGAATSDTPYEIGD